MELKPVNWELIKNPMNWIVVLIMFLFGALAVELLMQFFGININNLNKNNLLNKIGEQA